MGNYLIVIKELIKTRKQQSKIGKASIQIHF